MAIFLTMKGLFAAFAGALPLMRPAAKASPVQKTFRAAVAPMTHSQQWDKVSGVLSSAIASASSARQLQAGAAQQLDLATYALYNLFDELSAVMSEPLVREAAVVHRLAPKAARVPVRALAA